MLVVTGTGGVVRLLSEYRPEAHIVALTSNPVTFRRLAAIWGVQPILIGPAVSTEELIELVSDTLISRQLAKVGESVCITMSVPVGSGLQTNMLKIHQIA